jgi:peptidoglycan/LPS O-acetylase OafA/YrhL
VLRAFGRCSYGLYLIHLVPRHWYFLLLQSARGQCHSAFEYELAAAGIFLAYLGVCFGVAMVSFVTLERYFLRMKMYFRYSDEKKVVSRERPLLATPVMSLP